VRHIIAIQTFVHALVCCHLFCIAIIFWFHLYKTTNGSFHVKSTRNLGSPLRFWWNLVCLQYLWVLSPTQNFSPIYHIVSDLWPQIFEYFVKICSVFIYKTDCNFVLHYYFKTKFSLIEDYSDQPFKWSLNYGIST